MKGIRVFTLGIDRAVNEGFLRRLAELGQGGGSCELVESEDRLDAVMDSIHRRIGTPVVTDVGLEPAASGLEVLADALVPDRPPSLFAGSPLLMLGRYRGRPHGPVEVCGKTPAAQAWREAVVPSVRDNPAIAAAWARGQVRQLEDRYAAGRGDRSRARADHHRDLAPVRRLVPVHGLCGRRPCGGRQRGGRGAPDHAAGRDAGGVE